MGLDFKITLPSSCSDTRQNESRIEDQHKSGQSTSEEVGFLSVSECM